MTLAALPAMSIRLQAQVPKTWDDAKLAEWAVPVAGLGVRPGHFSEREFYAAPVDNLRTYPVYLPDREPAGYWESLAQRGPVPLIELGKTRTLEEWIREGRRVFQELDVPAFRSSDAALIARARSKEDLVKAGAKAQLDGTIFGLRWVVTPRGVELSLSDCSFCHTRHLPDGKVLHGAPFNDPGNAIIGQVVSQGVVKFFAGEPPSSALFRQFAVPWLERDIHQELKSMKPPELGALFRSQIPGIFARFNGSPFYPTKVPDLIGIRDRKYIDHTGTHRHREIGDLMRYAALVSLADSADFGPHRLLTDAQRRILYRFPDDALYALAQYIYALEPPPNPNRLDARAAEGERIFKREGCAGCHTPPLYTNNKLTLAAEFTPPKEHHNMLDILGVCVGTDSNLALRTRKGTGYYKVPSLKGVWYRGLYLHDGSIASLEDLFSPDRLREDYVPSGFKGYPAGKRPIRGHDFGLKLSPDERTALISFLRTL
jgi:hypothetical protein